VCASPHAGVLPSVSLTPVGAARAPGSGKKARAGLALETELWSAGYRAIAGVDEVGRGPWAGPVVAAAVILPSDPAALAPLLGQVDDSKRLTTRQRERLFSPIQQLALATGVGRVEASEIDRFGIAVATKQAMRQALAALAVQPDFVLLDFLTLPDLPSPQRGVPHGDACSLSIAAASIIAKVTRDRWMAEQETNFPGYGFARHKGYGTAAHHAALVRLGPCALHRLSFAPVAALQASSRAGSTGDRSEQEVRA
jgi:ribonuclease HII